MALLDAQRYRAMTPRLATRVNPLKLAPAALIDTF